MYAEGQRKMSVIGKVLTDAKAAIGASAATITTGAAHNLQWIPDDIGKLATLLGIILTSILIISHSYKLYREQRDSKIREEREQELHNMEIKLKKEKLRALKVVENETRK